MYNSFNKLKEKKVSDSLEIPAHLRKETGVGDINIKSPRRKQTVVGVVNFNIT